MSIISAGTTTTTALVETGDTTGNLVLQVNGTTPSLTLNTAGAHGVGASPSYGTSGQVLTSGGSAATPTWTTPSSGAMTLISTQNVTASSVFGWTGLSGYNTYILICNPTTGTGSGICLLQVGTSGTGLLTSNYYFSASTSASTTNTSAIYLYLRGVFSGASFSITGMNSGYFSLNGVSNSGTSSTSSSSVALSGFQSGTSGPYNQISISPQTGTITGAFSLYGISS